MTKKNTLMITLAIGVLHFIIVTVYGDYIATRIGTQIGQIVSSGINNSLEANGQDQEKEAKANYEKMRAQSEEVFAKWRIPIFLLSLPTKTILNPVVENIRNAQFDKLKAKEISKEQYLSSLKMTELMANIINSLSLVLLIYLGLSLYKKGKQKQNNQVELDG